MSKTIFATLQLFKVKDITQKCEKMENIIPFWILFRPHLEVTFEINFSFQALSLPLRVVWPWFFYWRISLMSRNVFHTHNTCLRWFFFATLQLFKVKNITQKCEKIQNIIFSNFWVMSLTFNSCRVAKNYLRHMLWVWKTFLDIREIRQ